MAIESVTDQTATCSDSTASEIMVCEMRAAIRELWPDVFDT